MAGFDPSPSKSRCIWSPMRARGRPSGIDALGVFGVALLARMSVVWWASTRFPPAEDGHYYDVLARRLASGAGFTWLWPDGAVTFAAHYPVGYPALVAIAYAVLGASAAAATKSSDAVTPSVISAAV